MESKKINQLATNVAPVASDLTIVGDPTTGVSKKVTLSQIASLFAGAVDFYTNLAAFPATGVLNTIYCAKDTQWQMERETRETFIFVVQQVL